MSSTRSPIVAALLAIALASTAVPLLPTGAADGDSLTTCQVSPTEDSLITSEEGYVAISHPASPNTRASQALYFHVFDGFLQEWANGQDAYVIHLEHFNAAEETFEGCQTDGQEWFCYEHREPQADEGFPFLAQQPDGTPPDTRIQFYTASLNPIGDVRDPDPGRNEDTCDDQNLDLGVPANAHYAVVYLRDGVTEGVQFDEQVWGPYTEHFRFELHRS